ncbi:MBL fold metallo-hydrolase RNA specificity domain-containing protein [Planctomicrobium sp. SH668]|uniref:MBL fold metallo-hydrolase RNA specificity domain-containing protein n=1 Tax=Planctomicrobium sp. SH668 TaxID=3448126 RepID=UPI003F5B7CA9
MKITFLGAASEVTGSQHLIETPFRSILLDCGIFQGARAESRRKNEQFKCDPKTLDAVMLSHAHLDHCGNIPRLYKMGFRGPVFCTESTAEIAELMLLDSAKIQVEDAQYLSLKLPGGHPSVEPLYTEEDVRAVLKLFEPCPFNDWQSLDDRDEVRVRFSPAGHILGSAIIELDIDDNGERKRIVFTGDLGRRDMPLLRDPTLITDGADVVICESTYGNRMHSSPQDLKGILLNVLQEAHLTGGRVIIPAFSLGRTQQITYYLNTLYNEGVLPRIPIFVDSPLANKVTHLFRRHMYELDEDCQKTLEHDQDPFGFEQLTYIANAQESRALNQRMGAFVVISASGMCESGRIVHHLKHAVGDSKNTILLMGYQAPHTLGHQIAKRQSVVKIFDRQVPLKANVLQLDGLSAHADATDLKWWFDESTRDNSFGQVFLVHGEREAAESLGMMIRDNIDEDAIVPRFGDSFEV